MSKDSTNLSRVYLGSAIGGSFRSCISSNQYIDWSAIHCSFSGVETDSDGAISRAQALLLSFKLKEGVTDEQIAAWADNLEEQVRNFELEQEILFCPMIYTTEILAESPF